MMKELLRRSVLSLAIFLASLTFVLGQGTTGLLTEL